MKFKIFRFSKVKSTNNTARRIIKKYNYDFGMISSDLQINGRGQYGKKWISYEGNLFVSFFYNLKNFRTPLSKLTKINCLLVKKCIAQYYKKKIYFKKPNDLLIEKKKICGVLQEIIFMENKKYLITGIGININKSPYIKKCPTTNLNELTNKHIKINEIEKSLKQIFENNLSKIYNLKVNY